MRSLLSGLLPLLVLAPTAVAEDPPAFLDLSVDQAFQRASDLERPVLIAWTRDVEQDCRRLEDTWKDVPLRQYLTDTFVAIQIDGQVQDELAREFRVKRFPLTVLLHPDRSAFGSVAGFRNPADMRAELQRLLAGNTGEVEKPEGESADDPAAWFAWANARFAVRDADAATEGYFWCLDHEDLSRDGFRARNLDFILKRLMEIRFRAEAVLPGLNRRRTLLEEQVMAGEASPLGAYQFHRFNFWMREEGRTMAAYELLDPTDEKQNALRQVLFHEMLKRLTDYRRYNQILADGGDILKGLQARHAALKAAEKAGTDLQPPAGFHALFADTYERLRTDSGGYYETLLASGQGKDAADLKDFLVSALPEDQTYVGLMAHAKRLEVFGLVQSLSEEGLKAFPKSKRIPRFLARLRAEKPDALPEASGAGKR